MTLPVTLAAAASLGTISLWLGLRIFRMRLRDNVLIGDGGGDVLAGRMRAHANLVEYAPFVLALMALIELARVQPYARGHRCNICCCPDRPPDRNGPAPLQRTASRRCDPDMASAGIPRRLGCADRNRRSLMRLRANYS